MTISSTTNRVHFSGDGSTTNFPFNFACFALSDLTVTLFNTSTNADVSPQPIYNGAATYDFSTFGSLDTALNEYTAGLTVVFNTAPPSTYRVTIERTIAADQQVNLADRAPIPANTVNRAFDKLTAQTQGDRDKLSRALLTPSSDTSSYLGTVPAFANRVGRVAGYDDNGNPTVSVATMDQLDNLVLNSDSFVASALFAYVTSIGSLRALTDRPPVVDVLGYYAARDNRPLKYYWNAGDATSDNSGTVIAPLVGAAGRYRLLDTTEINIKDFGATGDGVTDDTNAIRAAFSAGAGGRIRVPAGNYVLNNIVQFSTANTTLQFDAGAAFINGSTLANTMFRINNNATGCRVYDAVFNIGNSNKDAGANGTWTVFQVCANDTTIRGLRINALPVDWRYPNSYHATNNPNGYVGPGFGLVFQKTGAASGYTLIERCHTSNVVVTGCGDNIYTKGLLHCTFEDCWGFYGQDQGIVIGGGMPVIACAFENCWGIGSGAYGVGFSNHTPDAVNYPIPFRDVHLDFHTKWCGFGSLWMGTQGTVGTGKGGFAIATSDMYQINCRGTAHENAKGGGELKYTTQPFGISIIPTGFFYISGQFEIAQAIDIGYGMFFSNGSGGDNSTDMGRSKIGVNAALIPPERWNSNTVYQPLQQTATNSGTEVWVCLGNGSGLAGTSGGVQPTGGTAATFTLASVLVGSAFVSYAISGGTVTDGDILYIGAGMVDGASIASHTGTLITSTNLCSSLITNGSTGYSSTRRYDGGLWWQYVDTNRATSGSTTAVGVSIGVGDKIVLNGGLVQNYYTGITVKNNQSNDNTLTESVVQNMVVKSCQRGIVTDETGPIQNGATRNLVLANNIVDVVGTSTLVAAALSLADAGSNWEVKVIGGHYAATHTGGSIPTGVGLLTKKGSLTIELDGGVDILGSSRAAHFVSGGVHTVWAKDVTFRTNSLASAAPLLLNGTTQNKWGLRCVIDNANSAVPGWQTTSGSLTMIGRVFRSDLRSGAPTAAQQAGFGEYFWPDNGSSANIWAYMNIGVSLWRSMVML